VRGVSTSQGPQVPPKVLILQIVREASQKTAPFGYSLFGIPTCLVCSYIQLVYCVLHGLRRSQGNTVDLLGGPHAMFALRFTCFETISG